MKIMVLHLSDIHITDEADVILTRAAHICATTKDIDHEIHEVFIVVTGDIAWAGKENQFCLAETLLNELRALILAQFTFAPGSKPIAPFVVVPGNHDCDIGVDSKLRIKATEDILREPELIEDDETCSCLTKVHDNFYKFAHRMMPYDPDYGQRQPKDSIVQLVTPPAEDDLSITFVCCNTALTSHERDYPGLMFFPTEHIPTKRPNGRVVFALYHHPDNWLAPQYGREFRKKISAISDIILSGHEHDSTYAVIQRNDGPRHIHIEAGALQDQEFRDGSSFSALIIDVEKRKHALIRCEWDGQNYARRGEAEFVDFPGERVREQALFSFSDSWRDELSEFGIPLKVRGKRDVKLEDLFVFPLLKVIDVADPDEQETVDSGNLDKVIKPHKCVYVWGPEKSGRTTLAKAYVSLLYEEGYVPVLLKGRGVTLSGVESVKNALERNFVAQYGTDQLEHFRRAPKDSRAVIIDDADSINFGRANRDDVLAELTNWASTIVIFGNNLVMDPNDLQSPTGPLDCGRYLIEPLNRELRERMIEKWLLLSGDENESLTDLIHNLNRLSEMMAAFLCEDTCPPYPYYVLMLLLTRELSQSVDTNATRHRQFYDVVVRTQLLDKLSDEEIDIVKGFLGMVSIKMVRDGVRYVSVADEASLRAEYGVLFGQDIGRICKLDEFVSRGVYRQVDDRIYFRYPFLLYYCAALHIHQHRHRPEIEKLVNTLSQELHRTDSANVLLFLGSLGIDPDLVKIVCRATANIFHGGALASLSSDPVTFQASALPSQVFEDSGKETRRKHVAKESSVSDRQSNGAHFDAAGDPDPASFIGQVSSALKAIQIIGELLRTRPGTLEQEYRVPLMNEAVLLSKRVLESYLVVTNSAKDDIIRHIVRILVKREPNLPKDKLAERSIQGMTVLVGLITAGHFLYVSSAIGSSSLGSTLKEVMIRGPNDFHDRLLELAIDLGHQPKFPMGQALELRDAIVLHKVQLAWWVMRELVLNRLYLLNVDSSDGQRICAKLGIKYVDYRRQHFIQAPKA